MKIEIQKQDLKNVLDKNPLRYTKSISLELSNLCNYSNIHTKCPTNWIKEKTVMSLSLIEKAFKEIGKYDYKRYLAPWCFSEPLIDPRLYVVLDMFKKYVPNGKLNIVTNGFFLYRPIVEELIGRGVDVICISIYDKKDMMRFKNLKKEIEQDNLPIKILFKKRYPLKTKMTDNFIGIYEGKKLPDRICLAPYRTLMINPNGDIGLCCWDWKNTITFGSIVNNSFKEILTSNKAIEMNLNLRKGKRHLYDLCSRCPARK